MNVLFIEEVDWLKKVVYEIHSLPELLNSLGHNVFFMDFEENWEKEHAHDFGSFRARRSVQKGRAHAGTILTLIRPGFIKFPILDRMSVFVTFYIEIERTIKENKIDAIVLYSCPTNGFQAVLLAKKYGIPIIYRSMDVPHMLLQTRKSRIYIPSFILQGITKSIEKWVHRNVNEILTLSPKLSNYVEALGGNKTKTELLLFGVDMAKFNPNVDSEDLREKLGITKNDKVIEYVGTIFDFSGLDSYLEQFPKVVEQIPNVKLIIVGDGALLNKLKNIVAALELTENVILTGFQPFDMVPQYINLADICINPFEINGTTKDIIPGKIIQYLSCAKPVLATRLPGMLSLLSGLEQGVVYSDINEFAEKTIEILADKDMATIIGKNGYRYIIDNHEEKKIAQKLDRILNQQIHAYQS